MKLPPKGTFPGEFFIGQTKNPKYEATGEFRPPKKGEYFLSGAVVQAYRALNDLSISYWIAKVHEPKKCPTCGHVE